MNRERINKKSPYVLLFIFLLCIAMAYPVDLSAHTGTAETEAAEEITVTFRLIGDTLHGTADAHEKYVNWIKTASYTFPEGATVYDVFVQAIADAGMTQFGASNNYVSAINAPAIFGGFRLAEFSNGTNSGWMYTVNGEHPPVGLKDCVVNDGDAIIWHYIDDYLVEQELDTWLEAEDISPEEALTAAKTGAKDELNAALADCDEVDYTAENWTALNQAKSLGDTAIDAAVSMTAVSDAKDAALQAMAGIEQIEHDDFVDVEEGAWYYDDVEFVVQHGIFFGTSAQTFSPQEKVTRAQFVTILGRYAGIEDTPAGTTVTTKFSDVNGNAYYASHVAWAVENHIVNGTSAATFSPNDRITRQDMATMIYRFAATKEIDLPDGEGEDSFSDDALIAAYAKDAVYSMKSAGIINGKGNNTFAPKELAIRAEAAAIMHRLVEMA